MGTHPPTQHLTSYKKLLKFCGQRTSWSGLLRESEEVEKSERRNSGKEARMFEPLTCFELIIKCNNV